MKNGALFLLIILISGLILAPFLGGSYKEGYTNKTTQYANKVTLVSGVTNAGDASGNNASSGFSSATGNNALASANGYDNYDHYSKSSSPTIFYGPNGSKANVMKDSSNFYIIITGTNGETVSYSTKVPDSSSKNSSTSSGSTSGTTSTSSDSISSLMKQFNNATFYGPDGGSARFFTGSDGQYAVEATKANGDTTIYTANNTYTYNYGGQNSASPFSSSTPSSSTDNFSSLNSANSSGQYNSSLPQGVPKNMIPRGQEDLYILKSEIVPPVCPACPTSSACPSNKKEKCPPCPACARCPEPSFECKKVPNYSSTGNNSYSGSYDATGSFNSSNRTGGASYLPVPVLSDFSTFGM